MLDRILLPAEADPQTGVKLQGTDLDLGKSNQPSNKTLLLDLDLEKSKEGSNHPFQKTCSLNQTLEKHIFDYFCFSSINLANSKISRITGAPDQIETKLQSPLPLTNKIIVIIGYEFYHSTESKTASVSFKCTKSFSISGSSLCG